MSPSYNANPGVNTPVKTLLAGSHGYAFGSFNGNVPTTVMQVTNLSLTSNVATATVQVREGNIPSVGQLLTIRGTSTAGGAFNVNNVAIATVSIDSVTGIGTITFALVHADVVSTPDTGMGYAPVSEVGEALVNGKSQAFALPAPVTGENTNGRTITWSTNYPSAPATVTMTLQAAMVDQDSQYVTLDTSSNAAGEIRSLTLRLYNFVRVVASNVSGGTNPTAIVRIDV